MTLSIKYFRRAFPSLLAPLFFSLSIFISCSPDGAKDQEQVNQPVDSFEYVINNFEEIRITVSKDGAVTVNDGSVDICKVGERIASWVDDPSKYYVRLIANGEAGLHHIQCIKEQMRNIGMYKLVYQIVGDSREIWIQQPSYNDYYQIPIRVLQGDVVQLLTDTIQSNKLETILKAELGNYGKYWVRFSGSRSSSYEMYLWVYKKVKEVVNDQYDKISQSQFEKPYAELDSVQLAELGNVLVLKFSESVCMCK